MLQLEVINLKSMKPLGNITVSEHSTVEDFKPEIAKLHRRLIPERQSIRFEPTGKPAKSNATVQDSGLRHGSKIYVKDLGPQISWKLVFIVEYAGPLVIYLCMYQRPWLFFDDVHSKTSFTTKLAAICWSAHYAKRLLETLFVHRFSHSTMPLRNLFKNCIYYWMFTLYIGYSVNHPLYTEPHVIQTTVGLLGFVLSELGNLSIHLALRNLREPGTTTRKIPKATSNPFTLLFEYISCPNYLYEFFAWASFTFMTSCLPAGLFTLAGMYQMTQWALAKHRNYKKEFLSYPVKRKAIIPFVL